MRKKLITFCLLVIVTFVPSVKGADYSGGTTGSLSSLGAGQWNDTIVAVKISIVSSSGTVEDVEFFTNSNGLEGNCADSNDPKTHQSASNIKWVSCSVKSNKVHQSTAFSYSDWNPNSIILNVYDKLVKNNNGQKTYDNLRSLLNFKEGSNKVFTTLTPGDYIIVEPMTHIAGYTGTAFELANAFLTNTQTACSGLKDSSGDYYCPDNSLYFCCKYSRAVFGGSSGGTAGGVLYQTIFLETNVTIGSKNLISYFDEYSSDNRIKRNDCLMNSTCGRGMGVFKYDDIFSGKIEITKYITGTTTPLSGAGFTLYSDSSCFNQIKEEQKTGSNGKVTFSNLNERTYYYKETTVPSGYTSTQSCTPVNVINGQKKSIYVYNTHEPVNGSLRINIKLHGTNNLITSETNQVQFEIYKGTNCSGTKQDTVWTTSGYKSLDLESGTYSIKEISKRGSYIRTTSPNNNCVYSNIQINAGTQTPVDIYYGTGCSVELSIYTNPTPAQLFELYKKYQQNGLLNLSNPSCTTVTCNPYDINITGCLTASSTNNTFNSTNLSCHDEVITDSFGNYVGFCSKSYSLSNELGASKFYSKAGQLLIRKSGNNLITYMKNNSLEEVSVNKNYIATAIGTKTCYATTTLSGVTGVSSIPILAFGDNNNDNTADALPKVSGTGGVLNYKDSTTNGLLRYVAQYTQTYGLNTLYLNKITGRYSATRTNQTTSVPVYGILSRFDATSGSIPFSLGGDESNYCKYDTPGEIIINDELKLEFRTIDTSNPFLRNTKTNWCDYDAIDSTKKCVKNNNVVITYIVNATNSYGLKNGSRQTPKYKITLTSSDIKMIRQYNKENKYDNYEMYCKTDGTCENAFLYDLKNGTLNKYEKGNDSTVAGIKVSKFKKLYGTLSHKLEI